MEALMPTEPEAEAPSSLAPVSFARPIVPERRTSTPHVAGAVNARLWTDAEIEILRAHYVERGAAYCVTALRQMDPPSPRAAVHRVYAMANKLRLKRPIGASPEYSPAPAEDRYAEIDERIREAWPSLAGKKGAVRDLARQLEIPSWWLSKRALTLGLTVHRVTKEPPWSKAELDLLERIPLSNPESASRTFREHGFNRTPAALMNKAKRLRISRRWTETLSAGAAAKVLGVDAKNLTRWIAEGFLKASKRETGRLAQQGGDTWSITREDLRAFVLDNLEAIDIRKVDKFAFVDLLLNHAPPVDQAPTSSPATPAAAPVSVGRYRPGMLCELILQGLETLA